jgi:hypothetical protein
MSQQAHLLENSLEFIDAKWENIDLYNIYGF